VIVMDSRIAAAIRQHGGEAYPEECCGAPLGTVENATPRVTRVERIANARREERHRRYAVEPLEYSRLEKRAEAEGLSVLGFYHSHPDHPAVPSEYDREHGFPFFHYVLVAVSAGTPGEVASYVLSEDRGVFDREELLVEGLQE